MFVGGGAGALLRWTAGRLIDGPWSTLLVNVVGCFLMGLLAGWLLGREQEESWRLLLGVGLLGGFTTFSAFALDVALLWRDQPWVALGYSAATLVASLAAVFAGLSLTR